MSASFSPSEATTMNPAEPLVSESPKQSPSRKATVETATDSSCSLDSSDAPSESVVPLSPQQQQQPPLSERIAAAQALAADDRLLAAARLLETVRPSLLSDQDRDTLNAATDFEEAIQDLLAEPDDSWKQQGESHGAHDTAIYYKVDDSNRLTCRIDTPIPASLLTPLLSVLNEVELYDTWLPSWTRPVAMGVRECRRLEQTGRANQTLSVLCDVPWPYATRQAVMQAVAVDDIDARGWIAVRMQTVETGGVVPPVASGVDRVDFQGAFLFRACPPDHVTLRHSDKSYTEPLVLVSFQMECDAHISMVPMSLVNFITRTVIGHMWAMLLQVAEQVLAGERPCHAANIASNPAMYQWIDERVQVMLHQLAKDAKAKSKDAVTRSSVPQTEPVQQERQDLEFISYLQA